MPAARWLFSSFVPHAQPTPYERHWPGGTVKVTFAKFQGGCSAATTGQSAAPSVLSTTGGTKGEPGATERASGRTTNALKKTRVRNLWM